MDEKVYWIWLQQAIGVGAPQSEQLLSVYSTAQAVYGEAFIPPNVNLTAQQRRRLRDKNLSEAAAELKRLEALGAWVMTPEDDEYQTLFEGMYAPPVVLYGKGERFDPCDVPVIAVVGTRYHDETGAVVTRRLSAGLAAGGAVVVSGGADGLDRHALEAALDASGRCISFQACGIDVDYPRPTSKLRRRLIENGGMLLSEFPLGLPAFRHHFRIRNRLISAVARGTLVTQAPIGSGAVITANWAREQGRDVFAVPGSVGVTCCAGSNELLKDGARLVTNASDILMEYLMRYPTVIDIKAAIAAEDKASADYFAARANPKMTAAALPAPIAEKPSPVTAKVAEPARAAVIAVPCPENADAPSKALYAALASGTKTASELSRETDIPLAKVLSSLTMLELKGVVACGAGQRYALCTKA